MSERPPVGPGVLLVGHDASRTGAPSALLQAAAWARGHGVAGLSVVLVRGGPLVDSFAAVAPTVVLDAGRGVATLERSVAAARSVGVSVPFSTVRPSWRVPVTGTVVANTLAALPVAARLADRRGRSARLVCHVHELDGVAARLLPDAARRRQLVGRVDHWIAAGPAVAEMLTSRWGLERSAVTTVDGFIEPPPDHSAADLAGARQRLGVEPSRPLVLAVGALNRRKGPERFVDLMSVLASHPCRPQGRWVGGDGDSPVHAELLADLERSADPASVGVLTAQDDVSAFLAVAEVVVSTSIEDPYPLVALEAAAVGTPVVGFDAGGLGHLLAGAGRDDLAVPVGDLLGLADVVRRLLDDADERSELGRQLSARVRSHHLGEQVIPRWWSAVTG